MTKIINVSTEPQEFTFNAGHYGPYAPGEVVDLPEEVAHHAVKRSVIWDDFGDVAGYNIQLLSEAAKDRELMKRIATYPCPWTNSGQCHAAAFKTPEELAKHLESHMGAKAKIA